MKISVVIPTYNRASPVQNSVESSLAAFAGLPVEREIIVVDDASTDRTVEHLRTRFAPEIASGAVRIVENAVNRGVTGSRIAGYESAAGDWAVFLDSDDTFLPGVGEAVAAVLDRNAGRPIVFFRCRDETGAFVGTQFDRDLVIDLRDFLENGTRGECLPVINKRIVANMPYQEALRGYEGMGYCRIIARHGPALLSTVPARRYDRSGDDRLNAPGGLLKRTLVLARGHRQLLREFGAEMSRRKRAGYRMKAVIYQAVGTLHAFAGGKQE